MAEYIEREQATQQCERHADYTAWSIKDGIESIPAADVVPVKEVGQAVIRNRLSEHLFRENMSQRKLADVVGTWQYVVSDVCQGRRIFDVPLLLLRVCKVLGCEPRDLYDDDTIGVIYPEARL